jgi:hypothetical protein
MTTPEKARSAVGTAEYPAVALRQFHQALRADTDERTI